MSCFTRLQKLNGDCPSVYRKGAVDAASDFVDDTLDSAGDVIEGGIDLTKSVVTGDLEGIYESQKDIFGGLQDTLVSTLEFGINISYELNEMYLDVIDIGVYAATLGTVDNSMDFFRDVNRGAQYLRIQAVNGDWKAALQLASFAVSIYLAIPTGGASLYWGMAMLAYTVYGITVSLETIGKALRSGFGDTIQLLQRIKDSMNLAFVNEWINGNMSRWMAGGILYDAPRAGDVLFNPTGAQNTTKFLGLQDMNSNFYVQTSILGQYHTPHKLKFGAMAGEEGFSVSSLVKG